MTSGVLLEVRGLHAGYGSSEVLFGVDLDVAAARSSGSRRRWATTLIRSLMGCPRARKHRLRRHGDRRRPATGSPARIAPFPKAAGFANLSSPST